MYVCIYVGIVYVRESVCAYTSTFWCVSDVYACIDLENVYVRESVCACAYN